jgi:dipeptidyl aminopeptidase/acylaminoacyl peptidase
MLIVSFLVYALLAVLGQGGYVDRSGPATRRVSEVQDPDHWSCHTIRSPLLAEDVPRGAGYFAKFWDWYAWPGQQLVPVLSSELGLVRLTNESGDDINAAWGPDGARIVWATDRWGNWTVWLMNADGTGKIQLTDESYTSGWPKWSPDGSLVAYDSNLTGQLGDLDGETCW